MNLRMQTVLTTLVLVLILVCVAGAQAPQLVPFSADMQFTPTGGQGPEKGKMYVSRSHMRMDMSGQGHETVIIIDLANKTRYTLMPQQHMYMQSKAGDMPDRSAMAGIKPLADPSNPCANSEGMTCKDLGVETVNGRVCEHWQMTDKQGNVSYLWVDHKLHSPIKSAFKSAGQDSTWQLTNIQEGEPGALLFEIPAGYRKMDMGTMMQMGHPPQQ